MALYEEEFEPTLIDDTYDMDPASLLKRVLPDWWNPSQDKGEGVDDMRGNEEAWKNLMPGLLKYLQNTPSIPERKLNIPSIEDDMYQYEGEGTRGWEGGSSGTNFYNEQLPNPGDFEGY